MRPLVAALSLIALLVPAGAPLSGQTIRITEPTEWREGRPYIVMPGRSLRVAGLVSHPSGVLKVLVNGQEAFLQQDRDFPDTYTFEKVLATETIKDQVFIALTPTNGPVFERRFPVLTEGQARGRSPWSGFTLRGIGYAVVAGAGFGLTMVEKSETSEVCEQGTAGFDCFNRTITTPTLKGVGTGLIAAAALGMVIDGILTSKKAKSRSSGPGNPDNRPAGSSLELLKLMPTREGLRLELLRIHLSTR